jgi:hypothetical protein
MTRAKADRWLKGLFRHLNHVFFDCRIPKSTTVCFTGMKDDGQTESEGGVYHIRVHKDLIKHPDLATIVLLHEMVHADLRVCGYVGYDHLEGHSTLFHAGIHKLWTLGAFETLL